MTAGATGAFGGHSTTPDYLIYEGFFSFDTSPVGATSEVTVATLSLYGSTDGSTTDFTLEVRIKDWGATLTGADWEPGADLTGHTRVASHPTASGWPTNAYTDLASDAAFLTNIAQTGTTYVFSSSAALQGTSAPGVGFVSGYFADDATGGGGTDRDPKLYVEYTGVPTLSTTAASDITTETASSGGSITDHGPTALSAWGVCWNTTGDPTLLDCDGFTDDS